MWVAVPPWCATCRSHYVLTDCRERRHRIITGWRWKLSLR